MTLLTFVALFALAAPPVAADDSPFHYPAHWWTPIPDRGKPDWEILPQAAGPGQVIVSKRNELGILSNFAATPFVFSGQRFASVEGFWQSMLYPENRSDIRATASGVIWPYTRAQVAQLTSFAAKDAGTLAEANMRRLHIDWVTFEGRRMPYRSRSKGEHYRLIRAAMVAKLSQNQRVKQILLSTGTLTLLPDHVQEENAPPEWHYCQMWMQIRAELQQAASNRKAASNRRR